MQTTEAPRERPRLEARRVRFDQRNVALHCVPDDPFTSHFANVLHLLLPAGERWFCRVYMKALPFVTDARVADDVRGFVRQEAMHAHAHTVSCEHLGALGLDAKPFTERLDFLFERVLGDAPFGVDALEKPLERPWLVFRVGLIAAIEQFTCVFGQWVLDADVLDDVADPVVLEMLRWHGAEEVEHRSVAFDLHEHLSGSYAARYAHMGVVLPLFSIAWLSALRFLLATDPSTKEDLGSLSMLALVRRIDETARTTARLPSPKLLLSAAVRYLGRDFHPEQEGELGAALAYLRRFAGAAAAQA